MIGLHLIEDILIGSQERPTGSGPQEVSIWHPDVTRCTLDWRLTTPQVMDVVSKEQFELPGAVSPQPYGSARITRFHAYPQMSQDIPSA